MIFEVQVTNTGGDQSSPFDSKGELLHLDGVPVSRLKFPSLAEGGDTRPKTSPIPHPRRTASAIGRRVSDISVLEDQVAASCNQDDHWLDLFAQSYFPDEYPQKPNHILGYPTNQHDMRDVSELSNDDLLLSDEEIVTEMQQEWCHHIPTEPSALVPSYPINPSPWGATQIPKVGNSHQQMQSIYGPQIGMPAGILSSEEPTLLTLTSYPFRVMYSNQAFSRLTGRTASVIGDSVFDIVQMERSLFCAPSMPTFPTLQGRLENHDVALVQALVASDEHHNQSHLHQWIKCRVHVQHVVTNANDGIEMGYLAVRFTPQHYIQGS